MRANSSIHGFPLPVIFGVFYWNSRESKILKLGTNGEYLHLTTNFFCHHFENMSPAMIFGLKRKPPWWKRFECIMCIYVIIYIYTGLSENIVPPWDGWRKSVFPNLPHGVKSGPIPSRGGTRHPLGVHSPLDVVASNPFHKEIWCAMVKTWAMAIPSSRNRKNIT